MLSTLYQMAKFSTIAESLSWSMAYESYGPVAFEDRAHARKIPSASRTLIGCFKLGLIKNPSKLACFDVKSKIYPPHFF